VMIVDDNQDAAFLLADTLTRVGYVTRVAHDGPAAMLLAVEFEPELALLDIGLPVMDGYELARRLRELAAPPGRLIAVTGYGQESDRRRSDDAGFAAHLVKPIDLQALLDLLAT
jgi:CheY-like chemotaxis protein